MKCSSGQNPGQASELSRSLYPGGARRSASAILLFAGARPASCNPGTRSHCKSIVALQEFPFSCRKSAPNNPFLREMVIPFRAAGYMSPCSK
jgi:hypothetical protein